MEQEEPNQTIATKKKFTKFKLIFLLAYITLLLSLILVGGLSKYKKSYLQTNNTIQIAKAISNIIYDELPEIEDLHNEEVEWYFTVNNFNGNKLTTTDINQVALNYKIEVNKGELTDLQYKIYRINGENRTEVNINSQTFSLSNQAVQEDRYCIVLKTTDDVDQKSLEGNIQIDIIASQVME